MSYNNDNENGRALDWNDEIENEGAEFVLLPEGDYTFRIEKFERARHNGSEKIPACPKAVVFFAVTDTQGRKVIIKENFLLHTALEWKLSELFASVGLKNKGEKARMDWNALYGSSGVCHVIVEEFTKKDGRVGESNHIQKLYPHYDRPDIMPSQPASQTSWKSGAF